MLNTRYIRPLRLFLLIIPMFVFGLANASNEPESEHSEEGHKEKFNASEMIMDHIGDSYDIHLWGHTAIPLPMILISTDDGVSVFMSSKFEHGHAEYNGYILKDNKIFKRATAQTDDHALQEEVPESWGGFFKGEPNAFIEVSITKNVFALFFSIFLLVLLFGRAGRSYKGEIKAPSGLAGFLEPIVLFVRDDIAIPNIGKEKYKKYLPYLLTVFFLIWINNLLGLVPIYSPNLTGNIAFTLVLALFTFFITTFSANKGYWEHIFAPPVPKALWPIIIPIEIIGIFTKPFALMIRLFANITAGHILILSLVSLIFIFETAAMSAMSIPFMVFMLCLELLVAALQAYIFTLLSALFIGMAVQEHH